MNAFIIWGIICGLGFFFMGAYMCVKTKFYESDDKEEKQLKMILLVLSWVLIFSGGVIIGCLDKPEIRPIDVYRGKTKLEIKTVSINDSIVEKDTAIIWK